jgi:hypothetical protein
MMEIVRVEKGKKYVLVMRDATASQAERTLSSLRSFIEDDCHILMAVYGVDVTIVPVEQVVGYKVL